MRSDLPEWRRLEAHARDFQNTKIKDLFNNDPVRFDHFTAACGPILIDFSKQLMNETTRDNLLKLAEACDLENWRERMFTGDAINVTEERAVLHTALRTKNKTPVLVDDKDIIPSIKAAQEKMETFCRDFDKSDRFNHVVNIGIGGSDLGANVVCEALTPYINRKKTYHFVSNIDATDLMEALRDVDPEKTLFIITSKTFTTQETLTNACTARDWLREKLGRNDVSEHFIAATQNVEKAVDFGISEENIFPIWDWVGGRYSLWSAVGISIALAIGYDNYTALLDGAYTMDKHFREAPLAENLPVILGLIGVWNRNFLHYDALSIVPYNQYMTFLPFYMQQLDMESNGKSVDRQGRRVNYNTGPIILGDVGTNAQHAYFQLLHQGTSPMPCDIIMCAKSHNDIGDHHVKLLANALAQTKAMMEGQDHEDPNKVFDGNRPTNTLVLDELTPHTLGMLLSLYEHKIFVQGVIWNINSFDQCGVELGKVLAKDIIRDLGLDDMQTDSSTKGLLKHIKSVNTNI